MTLMREVFSARKLDTVYIGGGTPTILDEKNLAALLSLVACNFSVSKNREWTIEANPGTLSREKLDAMRDAGVTRISIGAQSFDSSVLSQLGRRHSVDQTRYSFDLARSLGFKNIGIDLIACIPGVSLQLWRDTIEQALDLQPEHISVYALSVEEGTELDRMNKRGCVRILSEKEQLGTLHLAEKLLGDAGYGRYEISNYSRQGFECAHNVSAWRGGEYMGFGPAAASHVGAMRWSNAPDLDDYAGRLERGEHPQREKESLSPETQAMEMLVFGLRMAEGVSVRRICSKFGVDKAEEHRWESVFDRLVTNGLAVRKDGRWMLTAGGRDLADAVAVEFMK